MNTDGMDNEDDAYTLSPATTSFPQQRDSADQKMIPLLLTIPDPLVCFYDKGLKV
jgi:hypothetical protein